MLSSFVLVSLGNPEAFLTITEVRFVISLFLSLLQKQFLKSSKIEGVVFQTARKPPKTFDKPSKYFAKEPLKLCSSDINLLKKCFPSSSSSSFLLLLVLLQIPLLLSFVPF